MDFIKLSANPHLALARGAQQNSDNTFGMTRRFPNHREPLGIRGHMISTPRLKDILLQS